MSNNDQRPPQSLEAFVHRALRELPAERAPADLEARVFAALAARQHLPGWQAGWSAWPVVPRTAVLVFAGAVALAVAGVSFAGAEAVRAFDWGAWVHAHAPGLATLGSAGAALVDACAVCIRRFQPWLLGLTVLVGGAYALLIALGSGLYRSLRLDR